VFNAKTVLALLAGPVDVLVECLKDNQLHLCCSSNSIEVTAPITLTTLVSAREERRG
jgi:hypothetical protein